MRRATAADPYRQVIARLTQRGVRYVVIGMAGINYYASTPAETFATLDYDLFIEPTLSNVGKAVRALQALGLTLGTSDGALRPEELAAVVRDQRTLVATTPDGHMVELLLKISGFPFSELARDAATVTVRGVPIKVGRLTKLLASKRLAGRPKDRQFLHRYAASLQETAAAPPRKLKRAP